RVSGVRASLLGAEVRKLANCIEVPAKIRLPAQGVFSSAFETAFHFHLNRTGPTCGAIECSVGRRGLSSRGGEGLGLRVAWRRPPRTNVRLRTRSACGNF